MNRLSKAREECPRSPKESSPSYHVTPSRCRSPPYGNFHLLFILHSLLGPWKATSAGSHDRKSFAARFSVEEKVADDLVAGRSTCYRETCLMSTAGGVTVFANEVLLNQGLLWMCQMAGGGVVVVVGGGEQHPLAAAKTRYKSASTASGNCPF